MFGSAHLQVHESLEEKHAGNPFMDRLLNPNRDAQWEKGLSVNIYVFYSLMGFDPIGKIFPKF